MDSTEKEQKSQSKSTTLANAPKGARKKVKITNVGSNEYKKPWNHGSYRQHVYNPTDLSKPFGFNGNSPLPQSSLKKK